MPSPEKPGRVAGVIGGASRECGLRIVLNAPRAMSRLPSKAPSASCRRSHFARSATLELAPPAGDWASASRMNFATQRLPTLTCPKARSGERA